MKQLLYKNRFLLARRCVQVTLMFLYVMGNYYGWLLIQGNLSTSLILGQIPMSDPFAVLQIFVSGGIVAFNSVLGAILVSTVYGMFLGRVFCAWVCPMNIVTDTASFIRRNLGFDAVERTVFIGRQFRFWLVALTLMMSVAFALPAFEYISPISMLHRGIVFGMGMGWAAIVIIFFFDILVQKYGFCGHVCPLGGFFALITRFSLLAVKHDQQKCTLCMKCKDICPEKEVLGIVGKQSGYVVMGECIRCGRCVEVCDDDALNFSIRSYIQDKKESVNETQKSVA